MSKNKKETATDQTDVRSTFFTLIPKGTYFEFIKKAPVFFVLSAILLIVSLYSLIGRGINYGIDFKGGTEIYLRFDQAMDAEKIRESLKPIGYENVDVQRYGNADQFEFLIRVQPEDLSLTQHEETLKSVLGEIVQSNEDIKDFTIRFSEERIYVSFDGPSVDASSIESVLGNMDISNLKVQYVTPFGKASQNEFLVQFAGASTKIIDALESRGDAFEVLQIEEIGQKVGSQLRRQAIGAVLISIIFILIYVWFRFDFEFAPGAIVALFHDVILVLGVFSFFQISFDLSTVAAMLTIVGFSINDTIVTYDRIRENLVLTKNAVFENVVNTSINQVLSRTLLTSITILMATAMLLFFGGVITKNFALALSLGIIFGTYSSVFIASPLTIYLRKRAKFV